MFNSPGQLSDYRKGHWSKGYDVLVFNSGEIFMRANQAPKNPFDSDPLLSIAETLLAEGISKEQNKRRRDKKVPRNIVLKRVVNSSDSPISRIPCNSITFKISRGKDEFPKAKNLLP